MSRAILAGLMVAFLSVKAQAQEPCGIADKIIAGFAREHGERQLASGTFRGGDLMVLLVDPIDRSWTILAVNPNGIGCLKGSGDNFETAMPKQGRPL